MTLVLLDGLVPVLSMIKKKDICKKEIIGICSIDRNCFVFKLFFINYGSIKPFDFVNLCLIIYHMIGLLNNIGYYEYLTHIMILYYLFFKIWTIMLH